MSSAATNYSYQRKIENGYRRNAYGPRCSKLKLSRVFAKVEGVSTNLAGSVEEAEHGATHRAIPCFCRIIAQHTHKLVYIAIVGAIHEAVHGEEKGPLTIPLAINIKLFGLLETRFCPRHRKASANLDFVENSECVECSDKGLHPSLDWRSSR